MEEPAGAAADTSRSQLVDRPGRLVDPPNLARPGSRHLHDLPVSNPHGPLAVSKRRQTGRDVVCPRKSVILAQPRKAGAALSDRLRSSGRGGEAGR
jgi:hypothetical protein